MKNVVLNIHLIRNRMTELDLKQWWLAEQIGVDQKTVRRWLQGKIKQVKCENAKALAEKLECELDEIILSTDEDLLATPEDQKRAAELISSSQLMEKLGPIQEWDVLEALLKATIIPNLPAFVLGELYNKLAVACWRQSKIDQASVYADKAFELGQRINDKTTIANATLSQANIHSWRGETADSIKKYELCLQLEKYLPDQTLGSVYSNLGAILWEIGDLESGLNTQLKAKKVFENHGTDMNRSICQAQLSFIYLENGEVGKAKEAAEQSLMLSDSASYKRGQCMGHLVLGEIAARMGETNTAKNKIKTGLEKFSELNIYEGFNFEFAGRTYRILGELEQAQEYLTEGLKYSEKFPVYLAALYRELGIVLSEMGSKKNFAQEYLSRSISIFESVGAPIRASRAIPHAF